MMEAFLALLTAIFGAFAAYLRAEFKKHETKKEKEIEKIAQEVEKRTEEETRKKTLDSLYESEPLGKNEKRNSIIIVGIGGCGKTTLIQKLFDRRANPEIATSDYRRYSLSTSEGDGQNLTFT